MPQKTHTKIAKELKWRWQKAFVESILLFFFAVGWFIILSHPRQLWHTGRQNKKKSQFCLWWVTHAQTFKVTRLKYARIDISLHPKLCTLLPCLQVSEKVRVSFTFITRYQQWICFGYKRDKHGRNLSAWLGLGSPVLSEDLSICWERGTEVV